MIRTMLFLGFLLCGAICKAQSFDSARIYPLCMQSMYRITIGQDLIKNEVDTIISIEAGKAASIYSFFEDSVRGDRLKQLPLPGQDIGLCIGFFKDGKVVEVIGVSRLRKVYMGHVLYKCNMEVLKELDRFSAGLSRMLCLP